MVDIHFTFYVSINEVTVCIIPLSKGLRLQAALNVPCQQKNHAVGS